MALVKFSGLMNLKEFHNYFELLNGLGFFFGSFLFFLFKENSIARYSLLLQIFQRVNFNG
ncbi:MAG TPA: hypothetical protein DCG18_00355 [Richelia sp.]|nr:hypothetical protein [Richelia sp.]